MVRTAWSSSAGFGRWGSETDRYHRDRPGRTHMWNVDRNTPARLPGSRCHLRSAASASGPDRVFLLLQSDANAFVVVQGCAARSIDPARGSGCCCADSVGPATLLFADMIFRRDRLCLFVFLQVVADRLLAISRTCDESMAYKLLIRWSSAFTHSAFSSAFISCQSLALAGFSQCCVSDILDLFSKSIWDTFFSTVRCEACMQRNDYLDVIRDSRSPWVGVGRGFITQNSNLILYNRRHACRRQLGL
jgi:hypothetical protein